VKTCFAYFILQTNKLIDLAITCHWISAEWTLEEALLDFKYVSGHHDGQSLGKVVEVLEEYQIIDKLFCITTDNAGNNGKMMTYISKYLKDEHDIK